MNESSFQPTDDRFEEILQDVVQRLSAAHRMTAAYQTVAADGEDLAVPESPAPGTDEEQRNPGEVAEFLRRVYRYARQAHIHDKRADGTPYISHPVEVMAITVDFGVDPNALAAALLHDVVEDTPVTLDDIRGEFGEKVASLVGPLTKVKNLQFSKDQQRVEDYIRLLTGVTQDVRVAFIKLADRLHNMRTLGNMRADKQQRIADETLTIFAPLADRLGLYQTKASLEDLAFRHLYRDQYMRLRELIDHTKAKRDAMVAQVVAELEGVLGAAGVRGRVLGRSKHFWSIRHKLVSRRIDIFALDSLEDVHDLIAFRVLVEDNASCYAMLGQVHAWHEAVATRFKDYISRPKTNGYQSIHTAVLHPDAGLIEVQIRTEEMHQLAEFGTASHASYKANVTFTARQRAQLAYLRRLVDDTRSAEGDSGEPGNAQDATGAAALAEQLNADSILVITQNDEARFLQQGATVLDFAYSIHSDLGDHCKGAMVNNHLRPIHYVLKNNDKVKVETDKNQHPKREWLEYAKTPNAKRRINRYLNQIERSENVERGRRMLDEALVAAGRSLLELQKEGHLDAVVRTLNFNDLDLLMVGIANRTVALTRVLNALPSKAPSKLVPGEIPLIRTTRQRPRIDESKEPFVVIAGERDVTYEFARCCNPMPGEPIVAFNCRTRVAKVHAASCDRLYHLPENQKMDANWANVPTQATGARLVRIAVQCTDGTGMLAKMSHAISEAGLAIQAAICRGGAGKQNAQNEFDVRADRHDALAEAMDALRRIQGVIDVRRVPLENTTARAR